MKRAGQRTALGLNRLTGPWASRCALCSWLQQAYWTIGLNSRLGPRLYRPTVPWAFRGPLGPGLLQAYCALGFQRPTGAWAFRGPLGHGLLQAYCALGFQRPTGAWAFTGPLSQLADAAGRDPRRVKPAPRPWLAREGVACFFVLKWWRPLNLLLPYPAQGLGCWHPRVAGRRKLVVHVWHVTSWACSPGLSTSSPSRSIT
eukprot:365203-Chlamydomonas_euryale.AAC.23